MEPPSLLAACAIAFTAVFVVLAFLAVVIQLISLVLPARAPRTEAAVVAAISASVVAIRPGARVTAIVEES